MIAQELEVSLHMAFVEARQKRHEFITVEHLLLALLDNPSAAEVLRACAANIEDLRKELAAFIAVTYAHRQRHRRDRHPAHARLPARDPARHVKLYSDPNCSMPAGGTSTLVAGMHNPETLIFVKATSPATAFSINVIDSSSGGTALAMHTYYGSRVSNLGPTDLRIFAKPNIMAHSCFPVVIMQGREDAGKFVVDATSPVSGPTYPVVTDLQFFYAGQCESSAGSIFLSSQQGALLAYAKYTGALPSITMPIGGTSGLVHGSATVNVSQPGTATRLRLSMSGNFGAGVHRDF